MAVRPCDALTVSCDDCKKSRTFPVRIHSTARSLAAREGWGTGRYGERVIDLCPNCSKVLVPA